MAYEFTKQKLAAERETTIKRLVLAGVAGFAGLGFGVLTNDIWSYWGIVSATVLATSAGLGIFYLLSNVDGHS